MARTWYSTRWLIYLDGLDGQMGGQPPLATESLQRRWPIVTDEYWALVQDLVHDRWNWLDPYAAEKPEEFFAVVTEAFFEKRPNCTNITPSSSRVLR